MSPEGSCLRAYGAGEDGVPAFTQFEIERLKKIIRDRRAAGKAAAPVQIEPTATRCGVC